MSWFPICAARLPEGCGVSNRCSTSVDIKNVEPVLLPVPQCKGSRIARLVETSNAESPTQNAIVTTHTHTPMAVTPSAHIQYGLSINIPRGVPVALFLTNRSNLRYSYTDKTKASRKRLYPWCLSSSLPPSWKAQLQVKNGYKITNNGAQYKAKRIFFVLIVDESVIDEINGMIFYPKTSFATIRQIWSCLLLEPCMYIAAPTTNKNRLIKDKTFTKISPQCACIK